MKKRQPMAAFVVFVRRVSPAALRLAGLQRCAKSWATNMHERSPAKRSAAGVIADYCQP